MPQKEGPLHIGLIGTRGVPAHYGGFETAVEEIGQRLAARGHEVTVYCRRPHDQNPDHEPLQDEYLGMRLVHLPSLRKRSLETLSHTGLSVVDALRRQKLDVGVVFNAANAPWLPLLRAARVPVATHVDGLEWRRDKWGSAGKRYYLAAERLAVRWSDALIADAPGIARYYMERYNAETVEIAYGAPTISSETPRLGELGLRAREFHLIVARFEPENHVDIQIEGYVRSDAKHPLVVVGSAPYAAEYTKKCHSLGDSRVEFLGGVWDQELLDQLYAGCLTYMHGHSVGGTNPSLLRAIGAGAAVSAFDIEFNRDVLGESGVYWRDADTVAKCTEDAEHHDSDVARRRSDALRRASAYTWDDVADRYEAMCRNLYDSHARSTR